MCVCICACFCVNLKEPCGLKRKICRDIFRVYVCVWCMCKRERMCVFVYCMHMYSIHKVVTGYKIVILWMQRETLETSRVSPKTVKEMFYIALKSVGILHIEGSRPEWCISTIYHAWDAPFWSGTLNMLFVSAKYGEKQVQVSEIMIAKWVPFFWLFLCKKNNNLRIKELQLKMHTHCSLMSLVQNNSDSWWH